MANPTGRAVLGGPLTSVYIAGSEASIGLLDGEVVRFTPAMVTYLGAQRLTLAAAAQAATIPAGTERVIVAAEGGDLRWVYEGDANAASAGYIPAGTIIVLGLPTNLARLSFYGAIGAYANLVYMRAE